jgi:hypothetical protein
MGAIFDCPPVPVELERSRNQMSDLKQYLLSKISKKPGPLGDDCWLWAGSLHSQGYGQFSWNGRVRLAHRAFYQTFRGPIPAGLQVQHKCDLKSCCNPNHLKLGKHVHNRADVFSRGDPDLTPQEFERLCAEEAEVQRKLQLRRELIRVQLRRTVSDGREERRTVVKEHRAVLREQRKAAREEHEQERHERRTETLAKLNPEAMAKLKASIARLKESTPEELNADLAAEVAKRKQSDPRRWRRNGSAEKGASE